jgi:hypothetical protein
LCKKPNPFTAGVGVCSTVNTAVMRIIAVVGCQRSGTTLTGQILGAHPNAVLLDEPDGVYRWFRAKAAGKVNAGNRFQSVLERAMGKYRFPASRFTQNAEEIELHPHVTTLVLKAPNLTFDCVTLANFPIPVSIVYPVRDPRSVVASMMRLEQNDFAGNQLRIIGKRTETTAFHLERETLAAEDEPLWVRCATVWKIKSGLAAEFRKSGLSVFQFRYEDLVQRPEIVAEMQSQCGLEVAAELLNPETVYAGKGPGGTKRTRPVDTDSLHSWKQYLDEVKEAEVMRASSPLAAHFGYT